MANLTKAMLEKTIKEIPFDKDYLEATFQFKLMMKLAAYFSEDNIVPERNIAHYNLNKKDFSKREIDIVIEETEKSKIAVELKMPVKSQGRVPEHMLDIAKDIKFLEQLIESNEFGKCFLVIVTDNKDYWEGRENAEIYSFFRDKKKISGGIKKPTGNDKGKVMFTIKKEYPILWESLKNEFKYCIIEMSRSA